MNIIFKTKRLYLREFNTQDAIHFYKMNKDPDVIRYTGDTAFKSLVNAKNFLAEYKDYKLHNMGRWAVCLKENDTFLGWCGLTYHTNEKLVEVGYRFYKKYWNKGYATESAKASITYGFETLKLKDIYAHAHIKNTASHKVIEKCGLHVVNEFIYDGMPAKLYKIENPHYEIKQISAEETYLVRQPVLREGKPIEACVFDWDTEEDTFHLGLFFKSHLIGVASFMKNNSPIFSEPRQYQLRGMAILKEFQQKGLGKQLIDEGENILIQKKVDLLWFNAREIAVEFYKSKGFLISGDAFTIPNIGIHYVMLKRFQS
ncbi:GNAT family N-acetyltransferase [Xanthomarina gelatinilytica]|uniref:GNAT family N-acetyltransferase n=1 Tax=Xanthomarina gelatinilytica TaxID=1137281 RepID=UPI003AA839E9